MWGQVQLGGRAGPWGPPPALYCRAPGGTSARDTCGCPVPRNPCQGSALPGKGPSSLQTLSGPHLEAASVGEGREGPLSTHAPSLPEKESTGKGLGVRGSPSEAVQVPQSDTKRCRPAPPRSYLKHGHYRCRKGVKVGGRRPFIEIEPVGTTGVSVSPTRPPQGSVSVWFPRQRPPMGGTHSPAHPDARSASGFQGNAPGRVVPTAPSSWVTPGGVGVQRGQRPAAGRPAAGPRDRRGLWALTGRRTAAFPGGRRRR